MRPSSMIRQIPVKSSQKPVKRPMNAIELAGHPQAISPPMTIDNSASNRTHPQPFSGRSLNARISLKTPRRR